MKPASPSRAAAGSAETDASVRPRVLVADDDAIACEVARWVLERSGFEVLVADSAAAARQALEEQTPLLVLMDVHMGRGNGIELVAALRNGELAADAALPVIIITGDRSRGTLFKAIDVNIQGYILKPYLPELLIGKVQAVLRQAGRQGGVSPAEIPPGSEG